MKTRVALRAGDACYTPVSGDTLSGIAYMYYGDPSVDNMNRIYYSNMAAFGSNKNVVPMGQQLYLPG